MNLRYVPSIFTSASSHLCVKQVRHTLTVNCRLHLAHWGWRQVLLSSCFLALGSHSLRLHAIRIHLSQWKTCRYILATFGNLVRKRARKRTFCFCYISNLVSRALHKVLNLPPACSAILPATGLLGLDRAHLMYYGIGVTSISNSLLTR